jgi:hypothetical protein
MASTTAEMTAEHSQGTRTGTTPEPGGPAALMARQETTGAFHVAGRAEREVRP